MDNLTHSLAGAVLGQMGLKQKTGLGMATLIIAANIPDIDGVAMLLGGHQHLAIRRGITHGPIAMLILPLLLTAAVIAFDRWQTQRGTRPVDRLPINLRWLLGLAYIGTLSHPALDWLNSYGVRLLEPFSSRWFYGDSIFIIDIWIWAALIAGVWISRRCEKQGRGNWQRPAWISFAAICAYIFANGLISNRAEAMTDGFVRTEIGEQPTLVVANPLPVTFWKRRVLWMNDQYRGYQNFDLFGDNENGASRGAHPPEDRKKFARNIDHPAVLMLRQGGISTDVDAYLFWSRMPSFTIVNQGQEDRITVTDQRFDQNEMVSDRFTVTATIPASPASPTISQSFVGQSEHRLSLP